MRRVGIALAVAGLLMAGLALPVRAGGVEYSDPAGDARDVHNLEVPSRPSDEELDLLSVRWSGSSDELVVSTRLATIGEPSASNGWAVSHYFEYSGMDFELLGQSMGVPSEQVFPDGVYLRDRYDPNIEYPCVCRMVVDDQRAEVTVRIELHSIGSAARTSNPRAARPGPGAVIEVAGTTSFRAAAFLLAADRAFPSRSRSLTL